MGGLSPGVAQSLSCEHNAMSNFSILWMLKYRWWSSWATNYFVVQGHVAQGLVAQGHAAQGLSAQGQVAQGIVAQGHAAQGHVAQGLCCPRDCCPRALLPNTSSLSASFVPVWLNFPSHIRRNYSLDFLHKGSFPGLIAHALSTRAPTRGEKR